MTDICTTCGHNFDQHVIAGTVFERVNGRDLPVGGHVFCQMAPDDCNCHYTWTLDEFALDVLGVSSARDRIIPWETFKRDYLARRD